MECLYLLIKQSQHVWTIKRREIAMKILNTALIKAALVVFGTLIGGNAIAVEFNQTLCRGCHNTTYGGPYVGVDKTYLPDRHHRLVGSAIIDPTDVLDDDIDGIRGTDATYDCRNCHELVYDKKTKEPLDVLVERECTVCHQGNKGHRISDISSEGSTYTLSGRGFGVSSNSVLISGMVVNPDGDLVQVFPPAEIDAWSDSQIIFRDTYGLAAPGWSVVLPCESLMAPLYGKGGGKK
jgi:hypothetical protein